MRRLYALAPPPSTRGTSSREPPGSGGRAGGQRRSGCARVRVLEPARHRGGSLAAVPALCTPRASLARALFRPLPRVHPAAAFPRAATRRCVREGRLPALGRDVQRARPARRVRTLSSHARVCGAGHRTLPAPAPAAPPRAPRPVPKNAPLLNCPRARAPVPRGQPHPSGHTRPHPRPRAGLNRLFAARPPDLDQSAPAAWARA